jgi:hypothetical protein
MATTGDWDKTLLHPFQTWADKRGRRVDVRLLGDLLELRSTYDDLPLTAWPLGSVEHLLLERWPSKGAVAAPDEQVLVDTLDAYFRFLRGTGRMASRSGEPKELAKEARRAAPRMAEAAADKTNWSSGKVLMDFGRDIGIDMDDAATADDLQQKLDAITAAWNALPTAERRRRMPMPGDLPGEDPELSGRQNAMQGYGVDDGLIALVMTFAQQLPTGELPPEHVVAPLFRESPYLQSVLRLADWVGEGREVTGTRVLRPAVAHEAYDALGLDAWTRQLLRREYPDEFLPGVAKVGRESWIEQQATKPWSRAADCRALHRLWMGAAACGLVRIESTVARREKPAALDDEAWVERGVRACVGLMNSILDEAPGAETLAFALLSSYVRGRGPVTWQEIADFNRNWFSVPELRDSRSPESNAWVAEYTRRESRHYLGLMADTGLYTESDEAVTLTEAGDVFVTAWLRYLET